MRWLQLLLLVGLLCVSGEALSMGIDMDRVSEVHRRLHEEMEGHNVIYERVNKQLNLGDNSD